MVLLDLALLADIVRQRLGMHWICSTGTPYSAGYICISTDEVDHGKLVQAVRCTGILVVDQET